MRYRLIPPHCHTFLDALSAAVPLTVLVLTCSLFIQALVDCGFVLGRKPSSKSCLLAHLKKRIDADHPHLRGLPLTFCTLILLIALTAIWTVFTSVEIPLTRCGVGPSPIIAGVGGRVSRFYIDEGSQVRRGDILVQLDTRDILIKKAALEERIHLTEIQATSARSDLFSLYGELEQNRLDLDRLTITSPADGKIIAIASLRSGERLSPGMAIAILAHRGAS